MPFALAVAVQKYKEFPGNNGALPKHVMVFRDGVGEGQLDYVKQHEIPAIRVRGHIHLLV